MYMSAKTILFAVAPISLLVSILFVAHPMRVESIGVSYGMLGDNLPPAGQVVGLFRSNGIGRMRIYGPDRAALEALRNSGIQLLIDVPGSDLPALAAEPSAASDWVRTNVAAFWPDVAFRYIAVGNEVIPRDLAPRVLPAMRNVAAALADAGLQGQIQVSTAVDTGVLGVSYPPSSGAFSSQASAYMGPITEFLASSGAPLLVNVYPYFSYAADMADISLSYALFTSGAVVVQDGQLGYRNLFDATVDAAYAALEKAGGAAVPIVVSESGWPWAGGTAASVGNAATYNQNLIRHVDGGGGTPRRPGRAIEAYLFAMFNENKKMGPETERHFGLFYPDKQPVYPIAFS